MSRLDERVALFRDQVAITTAARVAYLFHQDPVALLRDGGNEDHWAIRIAAAEIVNADEERNAAAAKKK